MNAKKSLSAIGVRYAILILITITIQIAASLLFRYFWPDVLTNYAVEASLILTLVAVDLVGFPALYMMLKRIPAEGPEKNKLGVGLFIAGIFMIYTFMEGGAIVGNLIHSAITGSTNTVLNELMMNSSLWLRLLVVGIGAPVFEELIFRKLLIDRLYKYGAGVAILASGLMFGLFHGNFAQFFYAFLLGAFFAAIYVKTGNIIYTIIYHMIINCFSSVLGVAALTDYQKNGMNSLFYVVYAVILVGFAFIGLILLIVLGKKYLPEKKTKVQAEADADATVNDEKLSAGDLFKSVGMWIFYGVIVVMFCIQYGVIHL